MYIKYDNVLYCTKKYNGCIYLLLFDRSLFEKLGCVIPVLWFVCIENGIHLINYQSKEKSMITTFKNNHLKRVCYEFQLKTNSTFKTNRYSRAVTT